MNMREKLKFYFLLSIAFILMIVGISQNQNLMVLKKAIKICLECVGIG